MTEAIPREHRSEMGIGKGGMVPVVLPARPGLTQSFGPSLVGGGATGVSGSRAGDL
ncbi:MAG TPA: hypothetical protein VH092_10460 [Urbifossiella sp.]|nr:hypothetical protein [Urbifossiella sp.]